MKTQRIKNDFYETNKNLTFALLDRVPHIQGLIFEPTSGKNAIVKAMQDQKYNGRFSDIMTNDIDTNMPSHFHFNAGGAYTKFAERFPDFDWAIGNPPFNRAHEIIPNCFQHCNQGIAMLLRLSYAEPTMKRNVRGAWLREMSDHQICEIRFGNPRPKYRIDVNGHDPVTTQWFVWDKTFSWSALGLMSPFQYAFDWAE